MKNKLFVLMVMLFYSILFAQSGYKVQENYKFGPGCEYKKYVNQSLPMQIHVSIMDLNNSYLSVECATSFDKMSGKETTSAVSKRTSSGGHQAVCAVNGDFYDTSNGVTLSPCLINGEFTHTPFNHRKGFAYAQEKKGLILRPWFSASVISENRAESYAITNINLACEQDEICLYNNYIGSSTGTSAGGTECLLSAVTDWYVNDTVLCVVEVLDSISNNRSIPEGKCVLSGSGTGAGFLRSYCQVGDTVRIVQRFSTDVEKITQYMGGACQMMENGINVAEASGIEEGVWSAYLSGRNPRTVIGFNEDSTVIYFVVVDGRQAGFSIGMGMNELVDFMSAIGIKNAVNLDGGGSSTMVVRHSVKNSPSDGAERAVANAVLCYSSSQTGDMEHIQIAKDSIAIYKNTSVNVGITAWDEYYNPKNISDWDLIDVAYDGLMGSFLENIFTSNNLSGDCRITASYKNDIDTLMIHVIELSDISAYPEILTIDSVNSVKYEISAKNESGSTKIYNNSIFTFAVTDPTIAEIDSEGVIIGKQGGETDVVIAYGDETDTVRVRVQIGEGEIVVDEIESISAWNMRTDAYIDEANTSISLCDRSTGTGTKAIQVDYTRTGDEDGNIYLETNAIDLYGVPSDILIDVESDSNKNWIYALMEDNRGVEYSVKCASSLKYKNEYRTQYLDFSKMLPADGEQLYPLKFKGLRLRIDDKATSGSMYIDRVRVIYPTWTAIEDHDANVIPENFKLLQNYPNPFNPSTCIDFQLSSDAHVELSIYSLNGKKVATLLNGVRAAGNYSVHFDASDLAGGVYFYRLQAGNWVDTKKMLLIK